MEVAEAFEDRTLSWGWSCAQATRPSSSFAGFRQGTKLGLPNGVGVGTGAPVTEARKVTDHHAE